MQNTLFTKFKSEGQIKEVIKYKSDFCKVWTDDSLELCDENIMVLYRKFSIKPVAVKKSKGLIRMFRVLEQFKWPDWYESTFQDFKTEENAKCFMDGELDFIKFRRENNVIFDNHRYFLKQTDEGFINWIPNID